MNPLQWAQDNIFYTDAKTKKINEAASRSARMSSIPSMMTPGQTYGDSSYSQQQKTDAINKGVNDFFGIGKKPSTVVGPGGGNGFGLGSKNTVNTPRSEEVVSPTNNPPNNAAEINARLAQQKKEREAALAVTKGNYDHSSGGYTGQDVAFVPDSTIDTGSGGGGGNRNSERTNANGVVQKGTDMSRSFNDLLRTTNTSGYQPFGSTQLPTTAGSPDAAVSPKTQAITNIGPVADGQEYANNLGRQGTQGFGPLADGQVYGNLLENAPGAGTKGVGPLADGAAYARAVEGKGKSTSRLDAALNDKAGINSYMSKFSSGDRERAANRAFLDTEGSMEALRAKEAVNGVVYAQQKHYIAGADADGPAQEITRDQARNISSGKTTADALLKSYTTSITEKAKESPAERQDPATLAQDAVKSGFAAGAKTDFELNNSQGATRTGVGPVVPTDQIPKDLSGAAGTKYLQDLDAGRLFK